MKQRCVNCQFLCKVHLNHAGKESRHTWNSEERELGFIGEHYSAVCAEGVWSTQVNPHIDPRDEIYKNRRKDCLSFVEIHSGMTFQAAKALLDRRQRSAKSRRERVMLVFAVLGWVIAFVMGVFEILKHVIR